MSVEEFSLRDMIGPKEKEETTYIFGSKDMGNRETIGTTINQVVQSYSNVMGIRHVQKGVYTHATQVQ
jgi:hypothetical protein